MKKMLLITLVLLLACVLAYNFWSKDEGEKNLIPKTTKRPKEQSKQVTKISQVFKEKNLKSGEIPCETSECLQEKMEQVYREVSKKPLEQLDVAELITRMVYPFFLEDQKSLNTLEMSKIADLVIERDTTLYAAHKVKLMALAIPFLLEKEGDEEAFLNKLNDMESDFGVDYDPQLGDLRAFLYKKTGKMDRLEEYSQKLIEANPYSGAGYYYRAMFMREKGDRKKVGEYLEQAIKVDPENKQFQETLGKFKAGEKNYFTVSLSFNFDNL
jgi:tetratricopeptide (TPR) repeat protein